MVVENALSVIIPESPISVQLGQDLVTAMHMGIVIMLIKPFGSHSCPGDVGIVNEPAQHFF